MLAVAETSEQHGDIHCEGGGAKKCFFAHPDQLLRAMCADEDEAVRREAVNKIRKLMDQYIPNTKDEPFPEAEAFSELEEDDERPLH